MVNLPVPARASISSTDDPNPSAMPVKPSAPFGDRPASATIYGHPTAA
jgi:hypothetical protein